MRSKITFKKDIRNKLLQFSILPMILLSIIFTTYIYFMLVSSYEKANKSVLKNIDYSLNYFFITTLNKIKHLKNDKMKDDEVNFMFSHNNEFDSMMVLNQNGIITKSYFKEKNKNNSFSGFDYTNNKIYKKFISNNHKPFFSNVYFSSLTNKRNISYIFEYNKNIYLINLNLKEINKYILYINNSFEGDVLVIDKNGKYIIDTNAETLTNSSFYNTQIYEKTINNKKQYKYIKYYSASIKDYKYISYMKNAKTNWLVVIVNSNDKLVLLLQKIITFLILFIIIILILILIGVTKVTQKIVNPIYNITEQMNILSNHDKNKMTYINEDIEYPMFRKIAHSFNIMQDKIHKREDELLELNRSLEYKVRQKTEQLEEINNNLQIKINYEIEQNSKKEKILFEQSKMASMGEMIGNIAHQWRQPLSLISTISSGLKFKYEMGKFNKNEYLSSLDKIVHSTEYLSNTIDDFRNFFKTDKKAHEFYIDNVINKAIVLMGNSFTSNNIELKTDIENKLIYGYENELLQALLNILNNAKDALIDNDNKKLIIISTKSDTKNIKIYIQDNANGVPQNIIDKIYEPYFTTKHQTQGTGIGLYMTKEIIEKHMNGNINVKNKSFVYENIEYIGAIFKITIPMKLKESNLKSI